MSDEKVRVEIAEEKPSKGRMQKARAWLGEKIAGSDAPERIEDTWRRIHKVGGFVPIFIEGRLELRTQKMQAILEEIEADMKQCRTLEDFQKVMFESNIKVFNLFHLAGSQWIRGLQDKRLAKKVRAYLELFQRIGDNPAFTWDLFTCSMEMLNISWKPEDVGRLPPYLIETKTVIQPVEERRLKMDDAQVT